jgi:hypothetical protein
MADITRQLIPVPAPPPPPPRVRYQLSLSEAEMLYLTSVVGQAPVLHPVMVEGERVDPCELFMDMRETLGRPILTRQQLLFPEIP